MLFFRTFAAEACHAFFPSIDASLTCFGIPLTCRCHRDVLGDTRFIGSINASTVWQCTVPNHEITCFTRDWNCTECLQILLLRIGAIWKVFYPFINFIMESGYTGERALVGCGIGEIEDALHMESDRDPRRTCPNEVLSLCVQIYRGHWVDSCWRDRS